MRTIVDVTQLAHWSGKLTGIPRVMYELAVRFAREQDDAVFAVWVKDLQAMCEIDFARTMAQRGNGIVYLHIGQETPQAAAIPATASVSSPADSGGVPASAGRRKITLKRIARYGLRQTGRVSKPFAERVERRARRAQMRRYKVIDFTQGDTLFIPWGEWWDNNFIAKLQQWQGQGARLAPIIHDIGPMVAPQFSGHSTESLGAYCRAIVPIADLTLAVSQNTKKDLTQWLKDQQLTPKRIEVFRLGEDFSFSKPRRPADPAFVQSGLKGDDYIMCVGTVELKKNHLLLYYAYKLAQQRGIELPKLLIVGRRGWKTETTLELIAEDPATANEIIGLHDISDEELTWLYDHCLFTVLPSFYEGWGIPIAESVAHGVPCACSNTSSMVEIAEDCVVHFSPYSTEECLAALQQLLDNKTRAALQKRAKAYKQTTWDDSYQQVTMYLEQL
jgi:glycosyltransferase involved in cell wall biosynthesis